MNIINLPLGRIRTKLNQHCFERCLQRNIDIPDYIQLSIQQLESVVVNKKSEYIKGLWRIPVNKNFDLCLLILKNNIIKTTYINAKKEIKKYKLFVNG